MLLEKTKAFLPPVPKLSKILGPSFVLLGMGIGSGELILWPYLAANYGLGIIWGAVIGITIQFFINMEIERYTLATGESIFVGLARKMGRLSPIWFILSTIIPWMWPGIISIAGVVLATVIGLPDPYLFTILLTVSIGLLLSLAKYIYKFQELIQKTFILISVPFFLILTLQVTSESGWQTLGRGLIGLGDGFWLLPPGLSLLTFLGALAYSGAGGNLNLAQSFYIKEKGFGMAEHAGKISSILYGKSEKLTLEGFDFEKSKENLNRFNKWWKIINLEHLIVFWATGLATIIALVLLSFSLFGNVFEIPSGTNLLLAQGGLLASIFSPVLAMIFLLITGLALYITQFSILDATSRIISENVVIFDNTRFPIKNLSHYYYIFLWIQIALQIVFIGFRITEPFTLVIIGAVLNAFSMFVYTGFILWLNNTSLDKSLRPSLFRKLCLTLTFIFFGLFSMYIFLEKFL